MGDQEFLRGGNCYVVRTQATGTPSGEFEDWEGAIFAAVGEMTPRPLSAICRKAAT